MSHERRVNSPGSGIPPDAITDGVSDQCDERRQAIVRGLGFSSELQAIFLGGVSMRDSPELPGRKYLLAHAAREPRTKISAHIREHYGVPMPRWQREGRVTIPGDSARRWVAEISPRVAALGDDHPTPELAFEVSAEIIVELDLHMNRAAALQTSLFERMMSDLAALQEFVPIEPLARAVRGLVDANAARYVHIRNLGDDFSDSEVTPIWDGLEQSLFESVGSAAWAFNSIDQFADELNAL